MAYYVVVQFKMCEEEGVSHSGIVFSRRFTKVCGGAVLSKFKVSPDLRLSGVARALHDSVWRQPLRSTPLNNLIIFQFLYISRYPGSVFTRWYTPS